MTSDAQDTSEETEGAHGRTRWRNELIAANEGSRARDHLANERTFLAWIRTGLALVVLGLAVGRFLTGENATRFGVALILVIGGIVVLCYGTFRYYQVMREINRGMFGSDILGPLLTFIIMLVAAIGALLVLIV